MSGLVISSAPGEPLLLHLEGAPGLGLSPLDPGGPGANSAPSPHSLCDLASGLPSMSLIGFPFCEMGAVILTTEGYCEDLMRLPQQEADAWARVTRGGSIGHGGYSGQTQGLWCL